MLSVTMGDFTAIQTQYSDLELAKFEDYTIYEVGGTDTLDSSQSYFDFTEYGLRSAINTANNTTENILIVVRTTDDDHTITLNTGAGGYGGGELAIYANAIKERSFIIVAFGFDAENKPISLTVDANQRSRVFYVISAPTETVALAGMTITGGNGSGFGNIGGAGGGIYNEGWGTLIMTHCDITGNSAPISGGGIYNNGRYDTNVYGTLIMTHCIVAGNSVTSADMNDYQGNRGRGGGISNDGTLTLKNSTISENKAARGGGISNDGYGTLIMTDCTISENTATGYFGEGVYEDTHYNGYFFGAGGGIFNSGSLDVTGCVIAGNATVCDYDLWFGVPSGWGGGGIYGYGNGSFTNCTIAGNSAPIGGGIFFEFGNLMNCTVVGNFARLDGGGIFVRQSWFYLNNSIVTKNSSDIYSPNTTYYPSNSDYPYYPYYYAGDVSFNNNLIGNRIWQTVSDDYGNVYVKVDLTDVNFVAFTPYETWTSELWKSWDLRLATITTPTIISVDYNYWDSPIIVTWNSVPNSDYNGYLIQYATDPTFSTNAGSVVVPSPTITSMSLNAYDHLGNRLSNTIIYVRVMATGLGIDSCSDWGDTAVIMTTDIIFFPTDRTADSVTLNWNAISGATSYEVRYREIDGWSGEPIGAWSEPIAYSDIEVTLPGLAPATWHEFQFRAVTANGECSQWSYSTYRMTMADSVITELATPENVIATATGDTINVVWDSVEHAEVYVVQYSTDETFATNTGSISVQTNSATITGRLPGTEYYVRIKATAAAWNDSGWGNGNDSVITGQAQLSQPTGFNANTTQTVANLSWNAVNNANGYIIQWIEWDGDASLENEATWTLLMGSDTTDGGLYEVSGLIAGKRYAFRVSAISDDANFSQSN